MVSVNSVLVHVLIMPAATILLCHLEGEYILHASDGHIERRGVGSHYLVNGVVYSGQWVQDRMSGKGHLSSIMF